MPSPEMGGFNPQNESTADDPIKNRAKGIRQNINDMMSKFRDEHGRILDKDAAAEIAEAGDKVRDPKGLRKLDEALKIWSTQLRYGNQGVYSTESLKKSHGEFQESIKERLITQDKIKECLQNLPISDFDLQELTSLVSLDKTRIENGQKPQYQGRIRRYIELAIQRAIYNEPAGYTGTDLPYLRRPTEDELKELTALSDELIYLKTPDEEDGPQKVKETQ